MEKEFIDWLRDKEEFLNDEIENCQIGFTPFDNQLLGGVKGALRLYNQWLESGGVKYWKADNAGIADEVPTYKRKEGVIGIRNTVRRAKIRRASDSMNSA